MSEQLFRVTQIRMHHVVDELRRVHVVPLDHTLSRDYFAVFHCTPDPDNNEGYHPSRTSFRLIADPYGTGELGSSGGNFLVIENQSNTSRAPRVQITVVECLDGDDPNGFKLRDVKQVEHPAITTTGIVTYSDTVSNVQDFKQCWVVGGMWGAGSGGGSALTACITKEFMTSNTDLEVHRYSYAGFVFSVNSFTTVQIVEWGTNWGVTRQDFDVTAINPSAGFDDPSSYVQNNFIGWDGLPAFIDMDHTITHLSWHGGGSSGRLHGAVPVVRPGDGTTSGLSGLQTELSVTAPVNTATNFKGSLYTATNQDMHVTHYTPERGTRAMPRTEQTLSIPKALIPSRSESSASPSAGVDLSFEKISGARIPLVQYTGDSGATDNNNDGPMLSDFSLEGEEFKYESTSAATSDDKAQLYVQIADLSNIKKAVAETVLPTLSESAKIGVPGLKSLIVRELFEVDELVDHVDGRIIGTHEQVKHGDESSSVKMPRIIIEAISGNARWHGGVQNVTIAVYCYSRDGYSDAARMYELVRSKLQHERIGREGFSPKGVIRETERPHDGYNQQVDGYYIRGLFSYVGTL